MLELKTRRYREVGVMPAADGFSVVLDGTILRSPRRTAVVVPTASLAFAIAAEWAGQGERIRLHTLPLTRLANAVLDHIRASRREVIDHLVGYATSDLLCYRADQPADLAARQGERWQPVLDWLADHVGARLATTAGIIPIAQSDDARQAIRVHLDTTTDWRLGGVATLIQSTGSVALGLAVAARHIDGDAAWRLSQLDETFQSERWGEDGEAADRRRQIRADIESAARFLDLSAD